MSRAKECWYCGKEFIDNTVNDSKRYCTPECKIAMAHEKRRNGASGKAWDGKPWRIQPVCKICGYRRNLWSGGYYVGEFGWENTYCSYSEEHNAPRNCSPKGNHCDKYREERKPYKRNDYF